LNEDLSESRKRFAPDLSRLSALQRQLRFFTAHVARATAEPARGDVATASTAALAFHPHPLNVQTRAQTDSLDEIEARCSELESELLEMDRSEQVLLRDINQAVEHQHVLRSVTGQHAAAEQFHDEVDERAASGTWRLRSSAGGVELGVISNGANSAIAQRAELSSIVGVLEQSRVAQFERQAWRSLHGNLFAQKYDIAELLRANRALDRFCKKTIFVILCRGAASRSKIVTLLEAYDSRVYACPSDPVERQQMLTATRERLAELSEVLARTTAHKQRLLANVYGHLAAWSARVERERATCNALNQLRWDHGHRYLVGQAWCVAVDVPHVHATLRDAATRVGSATMPVLKVLSHAGAEPPSHFRTGEFTGAVQALVDAYGVPSYLEINPAVLACVTFPFLFGVMFGDVGHGSMLLVVALVLIGAERRYGAALAASDEIASMLLSARYLILAMALWSIYAGLLYSDAFGISFAVARSHWARPVAGGGTVAVQCRPGTIAFGLDPIWKGAANEIEFTNSLKKKTAVVLGVVHMTVGIGLSGANALFHSRTNDFWGEFVPQLLMFLCSFGYMVLLIVIKWVSPGPAPTVINLMIDMFLSPGKCCTESTELFSGQGSLQVLLLVVVVAAVPWMLFVKPCMVGRRRRRQRKGYRLAKKRDDDDAGRDDDAHVFEMDDAAGAAGEDEFEPVEEHGYAEAQVHQAIHTIEFVLGTVSNTASYLRLWALSLAHVELSVVFWEHVVEAALASGSGVLVFVAMSVWLALTVGVMLAMEALSAFLHALRLQWVEFQSKFYRGEGKRFVPFSFRSAGAGASADDALRD
jgi:V-type H+-transporting ATPase subunit a